LTLSASTFKSSDTALAPSDITWTKVENPMGETHNDWNLVGFSPTLTCPKTGTYAFTLWATLDHEAGESIVPYVRVNGHEIHGTGATPPHGKQPMSFSATLHLEKQATVKFGLLTQAQTHGLGIDETNKVYLHLLQLA
jgi:hypothetical protein